MGYTELIDSLRKDGEENINRLWSDAQAEADSINAGTDRRIAELREKHVRLLDAARREQEVSILADARRQARLIRLSAERDLAERLFPLALSLLSELRDSGYRDAFTSLAKELPDAAWTKVRVSPLDEAIAREHFPHAQVIPDDALSGGLEVMREDGKISVDNTLNKRMEKAWEDILPLLLKDISGEVYSHEPDSHS